MQAIRKITLSTFLGERDINQPAEHDSRWRGDDSVYGAAHPFVAASGRRPTPWGGNAAPAEPYALASTSKYILVIDDSATVRKITETTLHRAGYETRSFHDGVEAMKWLAEPGSRTPDLILVDLGLPKMDGYEVIRAFKARPRFANTTCVILSRRDGMVDKLKGRLAGAKAYITKPFTTQSLLSVVQTHITDAPAAQETNE